MRVLIGTDIEGVAGVVSFATQTGADTKYYEAAKKLLTAEVNAAVEGLLEAGADDILVVDGHGCGAIDFESLHPQAKLLHGRPVCAQNIRRAVYASYDVTVMIGQHAMAGIQTGNLNHTQSSKTIDYYKLNGKKIGEIAQWALLAGAFGIPLIFLSGDEAACQEAKELLGDIETASVKQGLGRNSAISLSAPAAADKIRVGINTALKKYLTKPVKPFVLDGPFVLEKRFLSTDSVDAISADPRYTRIDPQTVQITSDNILDIIYA
ncbi:MAG: M55 family metallopeptidase [Victivallaceae bacterium]|nr:M55 family metallopeptidase [Victivallaceae bacterium]